MPLGQPFVCETCGHGLAPPQQTSDRTPDKGSNPALVLILAGAGVLVLGGAVFAGRELGAARVPATVVAQGTPPASAPVSPPVSGQTLPLPVAPRTAESPPAAAGVQPGASLHPEEPPATTSAGMTAAPAKAAAPAPVPPASPSTVASTAKPGSAAPAAAPPIQAPATQAPTTQAAAPQAPAHQVKTDGVAPPAQQLAALALPQTRQTAMAAVATTPSAPPPAAAPALTPPALTPPALPTRTPEAAEPSSATPPAAALRDAPFYPVPLSGGVPTYPAELAADGRPGRVRLTCKISPEGVPSGCQANVARGGAPFAAAALAWVKSGRVRFRPVVLNGHAQAVTESWSVAFDEPPAAIAAARRQKQQQTEQIEAAVQTPPPPPQLQPAPQPAPAPTPAPTPVPVPVAPPPALKQAAAPPPKAAASEADAPTDEPFSTRVVSGGMPTFPKVYDEGRAGAVLVTCMIEANGAATGCRVLKARGGDAFRGAVREWLSSGRVRFRPVTVNGTPVARSQTWTIVFNHDPSKDE